MPTHAALQLVIPCYNEAGRLVPGAFVDLLASRPDIGLIFVDDGSTDRTLQILRDVVARAGAARAMVLTAPLNAGKAAAVQLGIRDAFGRHSEYVGYWDADLSTPLSALPELLNVLDTNPEVDIVMGSRVRLLGHAISRSFVRHYSGRIFATLASLALGVAVYDTQCGAKLFRATAPIRAAFGAPFRSRWIFDVEILSRYLTATSGAQADSRIREVPLRNWTAMPGSKLRIWHVAGALLDLARIARDRRAR
jgi:dolichyl-phosphate beta-glucosyltransferase